MKNKKLLPLLFVLLVFGMNSVFPEAVVEKIGIFKFKYTKIRRREAALIKEKTLEYYNEIIARYSFNKASAQLVIEIAKSKREFLKLYGGNDNFVPSAFARGKNYICINPGEINVKNPFIYSLLRHELTHSCIAATFKNNLPTWLEEGAATNSEFLSEIVESYPRDLIYNYYSGEITSKITVNYLIKKSTNVGTGYAVAFAAFYQLNNNFPGKNFKGYVEYLKKQQNKEAGEYVKFSMASLSEYYGFDVTEWNGWFDNTPQIVSGLFKAYDSTYKITGLSNLVFTHPADINITVRSLTRKEPIRCIELCRVNFQKKKEKGMKTFFTDRVVNTMRAGRLSPGLYVVNLFKKSHRKNSYPWAFAIPFIVKKSE